MRMLQCISGKAGLYGCAKHVTGIIGKHKLLGYLMVSLLACNSMVVSADNVKIELTEPVEYQKNTHSTYKELVKPSLVHLHEDGSKAHPDSDQCSQLTRETNLKVGSLNKTINDLVDNDKKIYDKTIEKVEMTTGDKEAKLSFVQRDKKNVDGGTITYASGGGTAGDNTWVSISNGTTTKKFDTGSMVSTTSSENKTIKDLTINGKTYLAAVSINDQKSLSSVDAQVQNKAEKAIALGNQAQANNHNDVALGSGSTTEKAVGTRGTTIDGGYYTFAGTEPTSTVSIGSEGNERTITNVAAGRVEYWSTDAINGSQLYATNQAIEELSRRIKKLGASAAALAALHPLDFDPDDKWDFAAGVGRYRGVNAVALGVFYRPNEDTMVSIASNLGTGDNMMNLGISIKVGQGNHASRSKVAMAKEIKELRKEIAEIRALVQRTPAVKPYTEQLEQIFPDVPENHWSYKYVTELAQKGVIEGYETGRFEGDRTMTRYEFVALLYRAIQNGVILPERILKEFSTDLKYFQIDVIERDEQNQPTIERIRVK